MDHKPPAEPRLHAALCHQALQWSRLLALITGLAFAVAQPAAAVDLSGDIRASDGSPLCAMVLASGQFVFSCNPVGVFSLPDLPSESDGTVTRQIYAEGFVPRIDNLTHFAYDTVFMTRSGNCTNYNPPTDPGFFPDAAGQHIDISGTILHKDTQTPICALVVASGQHMLSCDGTGRYALNIPLDANGQYKLQVYAENFAPTIQLFDQFSTSNDVHLASTIVASPSVSCGGDGGSDAGASTGCASCTGSITLEWATPVTRANGTPLSLAEIGGYRIYYRSSVVSYSNTVDVTDGTATTVTLNNIPVGNYFLAMTTFDIEGRQSKLSSEVYKTAQ